MKVAILQGSLQGGGSEKFTVELVNHLVMDKEYEIILLTGKQQEKEYSLSNKINRQCILSYHFWKDISTIRHYLVKNKIEIAVGIGIYVNLILCACNFCLKTKIIISERNAPVQDQLSLITRMLRRLLYSRSDFYVFQTSGAQSFYSDSIKKRSVIIPNPVMEGLPYKSNQNKPEIVAVGRLEPQKNYTMMLNSFALVHKEQPEYTLHIYGDGTLKEELKRLTLQLEIESYVIFEGFLLDVHEKIKDSGIFLMTSDFEGMPNSLMEAMAMGFPVVCTDCPSGGPKSLIINGVNGILTEVGNVELCKQKIMELLNDRQLCDSLSAEAMKIRETHDIDTILNKWKSYLREVGNEVGNER